MQAAVGAEELSLVGKAKKWKLKLILLGIGLFLLIIFWVVSAICMIFADPAVRDSPSGVLGGNPNLGYIDVIMPEEIAYSPVSVEFIINWLKNKNSMLANERFAQAVIAAGQQFNVNPLLLVAITGQEQSFVPIGKPERMAMNPWNVFGSWQNTNMPVETSALVAARTIARLSQDRPEGMHPLAWINSSRNPHGLYATDPNWWVGVSRFFRQLKDDYGQPRPNLDTGGVRVFPIESGWRISSRFGEPRDTGPHSGLDIACPMGTPIRNIYTGTVIAMTRTNIGGNEIWVSAQDGRVYAYWHLSHYADVKVGQIVSTGQVIGYVGSTGKSTGPHLHLTVKENGINVDPARLF